VRLPARGGASRGEPDPALNRALTGNGGLRYRKAYSYKYFTRSEQ
jgi:hypothetical protein